jgi:2-phospho-L-lactate transferase/gluconeogenesis factor (CofD/UPF0052 family)
LSSALTVIGRGGGLGTVLRTLRETDVTIDVIVAVAEGPAPAAGDGVPANEAAFDELSRSLQALAGDRAALARALRRPLSIDRLGRHPLGSLMLQSLTSAFGELTAASEWLGDQLGIPGAVLPATSEPIVCEIVSDPPGPRLRFVPPDPPVSEPVLAAIHRAQWILLAPGPVLRAVLPAAGVPAIAAVLGNAPGRVLWICDANPDPAQPLDEQLASLWRHGIRVDAILHDPQAPAGLNEARLAELGVGEILRPLIDPATGRHDRALLLAALTPLIRSHGYQHA